MKIHHAWFQKHFICEKEWFVFKDRTKELKDLSLWLSCHQDVKYSTTLLKVAGREFFYGLKAYLSFYTKMNFTLQLFAPVNRKMYPYMLSLKPFTVVMCAQQCFYHHLSNLFSVEELRYLVIITYIYRMTQMGVTHV